MSDYSTFTREQLLNELMKKDLIIASLERDENANNFASSSSPSKFSLDNESIMRYSRQLILPEFGPSGQIKLQNAAVLIVGCGGLGCPVAIYLAAAGVGRLGLVDYDEVEISNLHRQILHAERRIGMSKAYSIMHSVQNINSRVDCTPYVLALSSQNIFDIVKSYDVVLDCTDNVATRYLLNDACILMHKPLVSGSALRFEGQLTVYGFKDGPCYRCLFPNPPPPETVTNCSDGGVLGAVPGIIGVLQALETIKLICEMGDICSKRMILLDALSLSFRNVKLRGRQPSCQICGSNPTIKTLIDYEQFCGGKATDKDQITDTLPPEKRITVKAYKDMVDQRVPHILLDIRNKVELEICALPNSFNIPLKDLESEKSLRKLRDKAEEIRSETIVCVCRRGNDSQIAVASLSNNLSFASVVDVIGGLTAWAKQIDPSFPVY